MSEIEQPEGYEVWSVWNGDWYWAEPDQATGRTYGPFHRRAYAVLHHDRTITERAKGDGK